MRRRKSCAGDGKVPVNPSCTIDMRPVRAAYPVDAAERAFMRRGGIIFRNPERNRGLTTGIKYVTLIFEIVTGLFFMH